MTDADELRLDSLKETLRQIQRYIFFGIGSSIILLSVIVQRPGESADRILVSLPLLGNVDRAIAGVTLVIANILFGALAVAGVNRIRDIAEAISDKELVRAALTFPTIVTAKWEMGNFAIGSCIFTSDTTGSGLSD